MNKLTQIQWGEEHQAAIDIALEQLAKAVLAIPLESSDFLLETDASDFAVGAILNCRQANDTWAPVEFASKKLSDTQRRWPTREKEAFAIIFGLRKFEHYLRGRAFRVHTDHESLRWMLDANSGKIARWASRMAEFNMQIYYKKGTEMCHVDFMSRYIDADQDDDLQPRMVYFVGNAIAELPTIEQVVAEQQLGLAPVGKGYFWRDGHWYFRNGLWVPSSLRTKILAACHSVGPGSHPGAKKMKRIINRVFNWPNLHQDVTSYVKGCLVCQQTRPGLERLQGLFRTHPVPGPFQTVYMDYWSCDYDGPRIVLTLVDQFTKWAEAVPIPDHSESVVTSAFLRSWICRFGVPRVVITDNDKTFMGAMFQRVAQWLGITTLRTTVYHPEGNAPVESFHRVLRKGLSRLRMTSRVPVVFDEALQLSLMGYRLTVHSTTNESPGFLTYGVDLRPAQEADWRYLRNEGEQMRTQYLNDMRIDVQFKAIKCIEARNRAANKDRSDMEFKLYELVLTRNTPQEMLQLSRRIGGRKLVPRWSAPSRVVRVWSGGKRAVVRNLVTLKTKEVHVQDIRLVGLPEGDAQRQEWEAVLSQSELSMYDECTQQDILARFWQELEAPQVLELVDRKRRCIASEGSGGGN
jgi:transposase InsO family protein